MAGEFQRSLDFFLATTADANVTRIVLAGGSAKVASLHRAIERRSRLPLEVADAWKRVEIDPTLDRDVPRRALARGADRRRARDARGGRQVSTDDQDQPPPPDARRSARSPRRRRRSSSRLGDRRAGGGRRARVRRGRHAEAQQARRSACGEHPARSRRSGRRRRSSGARRASTSWTRPRKSRATAPKSINRLNGAKVVPAHVLHELGKILTREGTDR